MTRRTFSHLLLFALAWQGRFAHAETFALQPGDGRTLTVAQIQKADGLTIRFHRSDPRSFVDQSIARAKKAGKFYTLLCMGGDVFDPTTDKNVSAAVAEAALLGDRYASDQSCWGVHCAGCTPYHGASEEMHWGKPMARAAIDGNNRIIAAYAKAFPKQKILLAIAGDDPAAMRELIDYGIKTAPGRFLAKQNAWSAKMQVDAPQNQLLVYAGQHGAAIGFEPLCGSNESRFGGTWAQATAKGNAVAKKAGVPVIYQAVYPPDLGNIH